MVEDLMLKFETIMGVDYDRYKNHVYRVFLNCRLIDNEKNNEEKYAIAAVFHDIGLWTHHTFDYLNPSIDLARIYLRETQNWTSEISLMIYWHHKMSTYLGKHQEIVESFRKADWIDVSLGLLSFGNNRKQIIENRKQFPNLGFHKFLIKRTIRHFLAHPLKPLPMFKT